MFLHLSVCPQWGVSKLRPGGGEVGGSAGGGGCLGPGTGEGVSRPRPRGRLGGLPGGGGVQAQAWWGVQVQAWGRGVYPSMH